jgi:hypothetical protein
VSGSLGSDTVTLGGYAVPDLDFGLVDNVNVSQLFDALQEPYSGSFGLSKSARGSSSKPFFQQVVASLPEKLVAFYLKRYRGNVTARHTGYDVVSPDGGGEINLGHTNTTLYTGDINYIEIPTEHQDYWMIPVEALTIQSQDVPIGTDFIKKPQALIDVGSTLIILPNATASAIYAHINGSKWFDNFGDRSWYHYPCNEQVNTSITFGGHSYSIANEDFPFLNSTADGSMCFGAIVGRDQQIDTEFQWVVGSTFMKNVYT